MRYIGKSSDSGNDWIYISNEAGFSPSHCSITNGSLNRLKFNPHKPETVYASVHVSEVFKSTDTGETWTLSPYWKQSSDMRIHPVEKNLFYSTRFVSKSEGRFWAELAAKIDTIHRANHEFFFGQVYGSKGMQVMRTSSAPPYILLGGFYDSRLQVGKTSKFTAMAMVSSSSPEIEIDHCELTYDSVPTGLEMWKDQSSESIWLWQGWLNPSTSFSGLLEIVPIDEFGNVGKQWPNYSPQH